MAGELDVVIIKEESLETLATRQRINQAKLTFYIAAVFLLLWGFIAMIALVYSFFEKMDAPSWAVALESATVTGALAIIFKDHLPSAGGKK